MSIQVPITVGGLYGAWMEDQSIVGQQIQSETFSSLLLQQTSWFLVIHKHPQPQSLIHCELSRSHSFLSHWIVIIIPSLGSSREHRDLHSRYTCFVTFDCIPWLFSGRLLWDHGILGSIATEYSVPVQTERIAGYKSYSFSVRASLRAALCHRFLS